MSLDLVDLKRLKITQDTAAWLQAESMKTGRKKAEILRDVLHQYATREIEAARLLTALLHREGHGGDGRGRK